MTLHTINLLPCTGSLWKGNQWSDIAFQMDNTMVAFQEKLHSKVITHITAHIAIRKESTDSSHYNGPHFFEGKQSNENNMDLQETIPCTTIDLESTPRIVFDSSYKDSPCQLSSTDRMKLSDFFKNFERQQKLLVRIDHDVFEMNALSFHLVIDLVYDGSDGVDFDWSDFEPSQHGTEKETEATEVHFQCRSNRIRLIEYKLCVQEKFRNNINIARVGNTHKFEWFCKNGGENSTIDVIIHLKNSKGNIVHNFPVVMMANVELVYDDGSLAPLETQGNSNGVKSKSGTGEVALFRPMLALPLFAPRKGSHFFSFRIEEVSFHHRSHDGFKIKASPISSEYCPFDNVLPGFMNELIIVKSKPRIKFRKDHKGGRTIFLNKNLTNSVPRKVYLQNSEIAITGYAKKTTSAFRIPVHMTSLLFSENGGSKCLRCKSDLIDGEGHEPTCHAAAFLSEFVDVNRKIIKTEAERKLENKYQSVSDTEVVGSLKSTGENDLPSNEPHDENANQTMGDLNVLQHEFL